jgi:hypothetical protein
MFWWILYIISILINLGALIEIIKNSGKIDIVNDFKKYPTFTVVIGLVILLMTLFVVALPIFNFIIFGTYATEVVK